MTKDEAQSRASRDRWTFYEAVKIASRGDICYMTRNMMIQGRGFVQGDVVGLKRYVFRPVSQEWCPKWFGRSRR